MYYNKGEEGKKQERSAKVWENKDRYIQKCKEIKLKSIRNRSKWKDLLSNY